MTVPQLVILPSIEGGINTPHTPEGIAYYLDQAHRAQTTGANSAAVAMFRGALEQLLFEQGYKDGMLGAKIVRLYEDHGNSAGPKWVAEVDEDVLKVIKQLGDGSIHPNDGDVTKQRALDSDLMRCLEETFSFLLFLIYEVPQRKKENLAALKEAAKGLKK